MKIKKIKKSIKTRNLLILAGVSLILVLLALWFTHHYQLWPFLPSIETTQQTQELQNNSDSTNKKNFIDSKTSNSDTNNTTVEPTSSDISLTSQIENDGSLTIFTRLKNYSDGTCNLTISNNDTKYTQTAPILFQTAFSTCAGFNIKSDVLAPGTWQVVLTVTSKGIINTKTINVEMK